MQQANLQTLLEQIEGLHRDITQIYQTRLDDLLENAAQQTPDDLDEVNHNLTWLRVARLRQQELEDIRYAIRESTPLAR